MPGITVPRWLAFVIAFAVLAIAFGYTAVACGSQPKPSCVSTCGAQFFNTSDCLGAEAAEHRALGALERVTNTDGSRPWSSDKACAALKNVSVQIRTDADPSGSWFEPSRNQRVAGLTWCDSRTIQLGTDAWRSSSYTHELAHWLECAVDRAPPAVEHSTWDARGIWKAIEDANAE